MKHDEETKWDRVLGVIVWIAVAALLAAWMYGLVTTPVG